jgi:hypothetical protein
MKILLATILLASGVLLEARGEEMDPTKIKALARQIDDSLVEGHLYHIRYDVKERTTDAFYSHKNELIKLLQDAIVQDTADPALNPQSPDFIEQESTRRRMIESMKKELKQSRERNYSCDYSLDGVGFYLQQTFSVKGFDGVVKPQHTTTYVSDGKIMGIFNKDASRGVIEPATERPRTPLDYWTEIAYYFTRDTLGACADSMTSLELTQDAQQLVISGDRHFDRNQRTHLELRIDKATLTPVKGVVTFYDSRDRVHTEETKTWEYQVFSGIRLPKVVVEQFSETDLSGKLNLEKERVLTILDYSPTPPNSKDALARLLNSNFSIYDKITGEHYISGNPAQALDNLSK